MIEFKITIEENLESAMLKFDVESEGSPEATKGEIETATQLKLMLAAFQEHRFGKIGEPKNKIITRNAELSDGGRKP